MPILVPLAEIYLYVFIQTGGKVHGHGSMDMTCHPKQVTLPSASYMHLHKVRIPFLTIFIG